MFNVGAKKTDPVKAYDVKLADFPRTQVGKDNVDDFFEGGILPGTVFTLSARRGTGKTRFLVYLLDSISKKNSFEVAYLTNEESVEQLASTCQTMGCNINIAHMTDIDDVCDIISQYKVVVVDSLQGLTSTRKKEKESHFASMIISSAKASNTIVGIITHKTKTGKSKGDSGIEHAVDVCCFMAVVKSEFYHPFEDNNKKYLCLYSDKNRFGGTKTLLMCMVSGKILTEDFDGQCTEEQIDKRYLIE